MDFKTLAKDAADEVIALRHDLHMHPEASMREFHTTDRICQELDRRWGRGEKLMLGEPWAAAETAARPRTVLAGKAHLSELDEGVSAFCDDTRDAVKGSLWSEDAAGFVNGGGLDAIRLACCIKGWAG